MCVRNVTRVAVAFLTCFVVGTSQASDDYRCVIEKVVDESMASPETKEYIAKLYLGREFTVERASGVMAGALKNSYVTKPQVIDYGSEGGNSYKVVTTMKVEEGMGAGSNVYALIIKEYEKGSKKPFVFLHNNEVYFGSCTHF